MIPMSIDKETLTHNPSGATAEQLLATVKQYMGDNEVEQVAQAIQLAQETSGSVRDHRVASLQTLRQISPLEHALAVATILAQMRIDAVGVAAGMVFEAVDAELLPLEHVERTLGIPVGCVVVLKKDIFRYPQLPTSKKSWPWLWKHVRSMRRWPVAWVCRASSPNWKTWPLKYWNQTNTPGSSPRLRRRANSGAHTSSASVPCWTTKWLLLA